MERASTVPERRGLGFTGTDLLLIGLVLIWGVNYSVIKIALRTMTPLAFNAVRFSLATLVLVVLATRQGSLSVSRRDIPGLVFLGLIGHALYQILFINALARTVPANGSLLLGTIPIWVAIMVHFLRIERVPKAAWGGVLLSFVGIALLIGQSIGAVQGTLFGDVLMLGAAIVWAGYSTVTQPLLMRLSPLKITAIQMIVGTPVLVGLAIPDLARQDWSAVGWQGWGAIFYAGILAVALGNVLWTTGVQRVGNTRTVVYSNLTPVFTIAGAAIMLGDRLGPLQAVGAVVVLLGIAISRWGRQRAHRGPRPAAP